MQGFSQVYRCRTCPVSIDLLYSTWYMIRKARRNLFYFIRPRLATLHLRGSTYLLCTTHYYCCGRRHFKYAAVAYGSPPSSIVIALWKAFYPVGGRAAPYRPLCSVLYSRGGSGSLPSSVFGFVLGGTAPYCPLCSVYITGGGLVSTVPCVRLYIAGGMALYRPLCSVLYSTGGGQLSIVPCV